MTDYERTLARFHELAWQKKICDGMYNLARNNFVATTNINKKVVRPYIPEQENEEPRFE